MWPRPANLTGPLKLGDPRRALTHGVPGTLMPAFASLPKPHLDALVTWVEHRAQVRPARRPTPPDPLPPPADATTWQAAGCAACHRPNPPPLFLANRQPADQYDLFAAPLKGGESLPDLYAAITHGRPGTPMLGRPELSADTRWALAQFIAARRAETPPTPGLRLPPKGAPSVGRDPLWHAQPTSALATPLPILQSRRAEPCGRCHPQTVAQWRESRHAQATGPGLVGQYIGQPPGFAAGCDRCHAPQARSPRDPAHADGVSCVGCHIRAAGKLTTGASGPPGIPFKASPRMGRSDFCLPCHSLPLSAAVQGRPLLDTWREWAQSPYLPAGVHCQHCHLGQGDHRMAGAHDADTVRRAVQLTVDAPRFVDGQIEWVVRVTNQGAGHHFPTTATPRAVLRVQQRRGDVRFPASARLWAIGRTVERGATGWKEIADTRIPAGATLVRRYRAPRVAGATHLEVDLHLFPDWFYTRIFAAWRQRDDVPAAAKAAYEQALEAGRASVIRVDWQSRALP